MSLKVIMIWDLPQDSLYQWLDVAIHRTILVFGERNDLEYLYSGSNFHLTLCISASANKDTELMTDEILNRDWRNTIAVRSNLFLMNIKVLMRTTYISDIVFLEWKCLCIVVSLIIWWGAFLTIEKNLVNLSRNVL